MPANWVDLEDFKIKARDVTDLGHFGTGDLEVLIKDVSEIEVAMRLIKKAYEDSV